MFGLTKAKLIGGAIGFALLALVLFLLVQDRNHWKSKATGYNAELTNVLHATRIAADNPKLDRPGLVSQIQLMGSALQATTAALNNQNARVKSLGAETARQRRESDAALAAAQKRLGSVAVARDRLLASSQDPARSKAPCEFSDELKGQWK